MLVGVEINPETWVMDGQWLSFTGLCGVACLCGFICLNDSAARAVCSSLSAQQADTTRNPLGASAAAIGDGQRLYDETCQACHGPAGQGGAGNRGPALHPGSLSRDRQDGDLFHTIRSGVPGSQMPPFRALSDTQIWQLVSYIRSLASVSPGGSARGGPAPQVVVATLRDGREIRGIRRNEDTFSVQIMDASGQLHLLDKLTLAAVRAERDPPAPAEPAVLPMSGGVTFDRLVNAKAEPHNWLMYWGNFQGTHYSPLKHIDAGNVRQLQLAWTFPMPGESVLEATPLVVDGIMYNTQPGAIVALDARTGRQIWKYTRQQKVRSPYEINPYNRGAAVLGQRLFVGTLDAALVALDSRTGLPLWETQVADSLSGYSLTSAPLIVKDKVLVGITGGEFGARGFLDAYDAATGRRLWRWYAVPGPGESGSETWPGESWKRGGSPMWLTGSYDPELNLVYWTVGNPGPQIDRSTRGDLDNLFSDSVVAIDPDTGERRWHYQFTPNDGHDWDSCQDLVLVDRVWHGQMRKLLLHADRNGVLYVIDRKDGTLLAGTPFVYVNWMTGFDASGRPIVAAGSNSSVEGSFFVYPTVAGGTNFQAPSYSPLTGWLYLEYSENGQRYVSQPAPFEPGRQYIGRAPASSANIAGPRPGEPSPSAGIKAVNPETGKTIWDFKLFQGSLTNGVLATAGNVVFGASRDGNLVALNATTGKHLWHVQTGGNMAASPMSYAVADRQFVAISAGNTIFAFALPEPVR